MKLFDDQFIVVTGGAGLIGSHVLKHLNDQGLYNIIVFDQLGTGEKWKNLWGKQFLDLFPKEAIWKWLEGKEQQIEAFIHLGACTSTVEQDANYLLDNNYRYSVRLAEYALTHGHRFIYASSAATYGDGSLGFSDDHDLIDQLRPLNMYGMSKQLFDLWLKNQGVLDQVVGLKYFNIFGPNEAHKGRMASAVYHMFPKAREEKTVRLFRSSDPAHYPDGGQMRDFLYVKDAAATTCAFLRSDASGIFNVGSGKPHTWNDLAHALFDSLQQPGSKETGTIEYIPMPQDLIGKYQNYSCADRQKILKALGETLPVTPFPLAVRDYVHNYLLTGAFA